MKSIRMLCLCLSIGTGVVLAQTKTGTTIGQVLTIEPSARIAAMGNAGATLYGEVQAGFYNPAAIGLLQSSGIQFTHSRWIADIAYNYAAAGIMLGSAGNLYLSVTAMNSGEIDVRTVEQPLGTGERYEVSDIAVGLGYGIEVSEQFSVGIQVSYLQETIWHSSLTALALSVGTVYRMSEHGLRLGASISNFGTRGQFDGRDMRVQYDQDPEKYGDNPAIPADLTMDSWPLPIMFRVGLGMPFRIGDQHRLTVAVDAFHPSDNTESISAGAEWEFFDVFALRGGYQNLFQQDSEVGLTLGAGVHFETGGYGFVFDYSWADYGLLSNTQRLTLAFTF